MYTINDVSLRRAYEPHPDFRGIPFGEKSATYIWANM
jgi:hypothetical protein